MKKLLLPLLSILLFSACQKQITKEPGNKISEEISLAAAKDGNNKIDVCHRQGNGSYHTINISVNALPAHLAHGDIVPDADGDGYTKVNPCSNGSQDDCNDDNANINPGATEICEDGIDNNCNGQIDENCIASVTICNQTWMLNNLDVTTYRDGTQIPQVTNPTAWAALTTGAWCYYVNNTANGTTYGKLYNWYAVNDSRGLAPAGWHVPSDAEWTTLSFCLGGDATAGGAMKETGTEHWTPPNTGATNSSGFKGLPGGLRSSDGTFSNVGRGGLWWSSSELTPVYASARFLFFGHGFLTTPSSSSKRSGYSVRCLRD